VSLDVFTLSLYSTTQLRNYMVDHMPSDRLSATFGALADPTRRAILARLSLGEASVKELAEPFAISLQAISKHLKVLERGGLIVRGREAQWRPCRIEVGALREVDDWLLRYRQLWEDRLDRLGEYLATLQKRETSAGEKSTRGRRKRGASTS
jgi:DNA-binding transcriptional ArsR family regulator